MAYNDTKSTGDSLTATEWNNMVLQLESSANGHTHAGTAAEGVKIAAAVVTSSATGNIVATNVDAAIAELEAEKAPLASPTFTGTIKKSATATITAYASGGQASAVALTTDINEVSVCATDYDSVKLPAAVTGMNIHVINNGDNILSIYPASGDFINEGLVDVSGNIATNTSAICLCYKTDYWSVSEHARS